MKSVIPVFLSLLLISTACSNDERMPTYGKFKRHLREDMSYQEIVFWFGRPAGDIGSGIHIYVYPLADSSVMYIGFTDNIVYAKHYSQDGHLLHVLIG